MKNGICFDLQEVASDHPVCGVRLDTKVRIEVLPVPESGSLQSHLTCVS